LFSGCLVSTPCLTSWRVTCIFLKVSFTLPLVRRESLTFHRKLRPSKVRDLPRTTDPAGRGAGLGSRELRSEAGALAARARGLLTWEDACSRTSAVDARHPSPRPGSLTGCNWREEGRSQWEGWRCSGMLVV
jgi:hypothetical protein